MRHGTFEYEFDELQVLKHIELYAYGYAVIDWEYDPADTSVGETSDYAYSIQDIVISSYNKDKAPFVLPRNSDLYAMILFRLNSSDYENHILSQIKNEDD